MLKITLIPDAKKAITYVSTLCMSAAAAITAAWTLLPDDWHAALGPNGLRYTVVSVLVLGIVGRFLQKIEPAAPQEDLVPGQPTAHAAAPEAAAPVEQPVAVVVKEVPGDTPNSAG